ncbi:glycosyl transferase family 2 [Halospina denitrificans]|uniref:Glycosyl transferase family 2 n=1 Tax=Halospina denitrificans TaxID=332522 RepID=A0A4R7JWF4_9GAMM|nr:glycosyltransferase family 2 protein [Halospina denitrificans]TDT41339.1 glycosyl transferase family 2 [Halospina denitrificans]
MTSDTVEGDGLQVIAEPLVSLILITANRADWLEAVLDSIQAQEEERWELVAVDCGSQDNTLELLESRASDDSRVRVLSIEETDKAVGRRYGLQKAKGRYLAFPDVHSHWSPEFLTRLLREFDECPESTGITYVSADILGSEGEVNRTLPEELRYGAMVWELFEKPELALSALLIRRKVIKPLEKTGMRFWLSNDHGLLIWLAYRMPLKFCDGEGMVQVRPIEERLPSYLESVSEARGEALTHALENLPRIVPSRFARRCLADFYRARSVSLANNGDTGDAFSCALQALMYRPLWPRAWQQLLRLVVKG